MSSEQALNGVPRGRGSGLQLPPRFMAWQREPAQGVAPPYADGAMATCLFVDRARHVITYNRSPDVPFDRSINPYRGCEHGCSYCFARPSHAYLDLSPGLDFETCIGWKPDAAEVLKRELGRRNYRCAPIALGVNTDAYQPLERKLGITRALLEVMVACRHPVSIITKSSLIERDIDLLEDLARDRLVSVMFSVTSLDDTLTRRMEPRAARPTRRLAAMAALGRAGVPVGVLFAPLIPALNDHEMEAVLEASRRAGADHAGFILLRLPHELKTLFEEWLQREYPDRARHVLSLLAQMRGGRLNDPRFGHRMRGEGPFAELYRQRFRRATKALGFNAGERHALETRWFKPPQPPGGQLELF